MNSNNPYTKPYSEPIYSPVHPLVKFGQGVHLGHFVVIEEGCEIGDHSFIGNGVVLRKGTKIGSHTVISHLTVSEGENIIGNHVTIEPQCHLTKGLIIDDNAFLGPGVVTINTRDIVHGRNIPLIISPPLIGYAARVGAGCLICPGVIVEPNSFVKAGIVLKEDTISFTVYPGGLPIPMSEIIPRRPTPCE